MSRHHRLLTSGSKLLSVLSEMNEKLLQLTHDAEVKGTVGRRGWVGCGASDASKYVTLIFPLEKEDFPALCKALIEWYPPRDQKELDSSLLGVSHMHHFCLERTEPENTQLTNCPPFSLRNQVCLESGLSDSSFWHLETCLCHDFKAKLFFPSEKDMC